MPEKFQHLTAPAVDISYCPHCAAIVVNASFIIVVGLALDGNVPINVPLVPIGNVPLDNPTTVQMPNLTLYFIALFSASQPLSVSPSAVSAAAAVVAPVPPLDIGTVYPLSNIRYHDLNVGVELFSYETYL